METLVNMLQDLECLQMFSGTAKWYEVSYDVTTTKAPSTYKVRFKQKTVFLMLIKSYEKS